MRSIAPPRRQPDRAPSHRPTTIAIASPSPMRSTVGPAASEHDLGHGLAAVLDRVAEVARSAVDADVGDELVRDERLVEAPLRPVRPRSNSAVRCGFFVARSGEPGIIRNRTKLRITIATIVTSAADELARDVATAHASGSRSIRRGPRMATLADDRRTPSGPRHSSSGPAVRASHRRPPTDDDDGDRRRAAAAAVVFEPPLASATSPWRATRWAQPARRPPRLARCGRRRRRLGRGRRLRPWRRSAACSRGVPVGEQRRAVRRACSASRRTCRCGRRRGSSRSRGRRTAPGRRSGSASARAWRGAPRRPPSTACRTARRTSGCSTGCPTGCRSGRSGRRSSGRSGPGCRPSPTARCRTSALPSGGGRIRFVSVSLS